MATPSQFSDDPSSPHVGDLLTIVYDELRGLAASQMARQGSAANTLQPTALVHEAWIRLTSKSPHKWNDRSHFFRTAAMAMRCILVDRAREKASKKRAGLRVDLSFAAGIAADPEFEDHILAVDECLKQMESEYPDCARIVQLKFFAGLTNEEVADMLDLSLRTIERQWAFARTRLYQMISSRRTSEDPVS